MSAHWPPADPSDGGTAPALEESPIDPVPAEVRDAARRAFAVRDRHSLVLPVVYDSTLDDDAEVADAEAPRQLCFRSAEAGVEVNVTVRPRGDRSTLALDVQPSPEGTALTEVQCDSGAVPGLTAHDDGWWTAEPVPSGLVSLVLVSGDRQLRTGWLRV